MQNKLAIFGRRFSALVLFSALFFAPAAAFAGLAEFFSATGKLSLSVDGAGSNNASHIIQVEKPNASATVRKAFLMAASYCRANSIPDNSISINGNPIAWNDSVVNSFFFSVRADVTSIVKPTVDAAGTGRINFTIAENPNNNFCIDGEALVVVFDDPAQTGDTTVILLFGGQALAGDNFAITLGQPIDPNSAGALADMGLGISFGFQGESGHVCGTSDPPPPDQPQFSIINVNGQRLTSCAGSYDDGQATNGALITVGGLDDSNDNPADPFQQAADGKSPRVNDDELYSLLPFITATDTNISVHTESPSGDDNIFFAYFNVSGAAIVGEGIVLGPTNATNPVGTEHTVTAKVSAADGDPVPDVLVTFDVISGPNQGAHGTDTTDANGEATFTYTDNGGAGTDQIQASFVDSNEDTKTSNTVTKEWTTGEANTPPVADLQSVTTPEDTPKLITLTGGDADNDPLTFSIVTFPQHGDLSPFSAASAAQKSKAKRQKQKKQKQRGKPIVGTMASTLTPRALAVLVQSTAANNVTYTPDPNFNGSDSFTFKVNDGKTDSTPATVNITVTPVDDSIVILSGAFERRIYSSPGIAAVLKFLNPDGDDSVNLGVPLLQARNEPKGCGSNVLASDPVTIAPPFFSELESLAPDPSDSSQSIGEIKTLEIGPAARDAATALGCNVTLVLMGFTVHLVGNSSHQFAGTACIDTDTDLVTSPCSSATSTASRQVRSSSTAGAKIAAPVVR